MTATQLIAFVVMPLALLILGWAVAFAVDWKGRHGSNASAKPEPKTAGAILEELTRMGEREMLAKAEALVTMKTLLEKLGITDDKRGGAEDKQAS